MTNNQTDATKAAVNAAMAPTQSRFATWIQDPIASAYLATATTALAVMFVLGGMSIVNMAVHS